MKKLACLVLLVPIGLYLPNLDHFAFPLLSRFSDLLITHFPNANFIHQSVFLNHELPLWNDSILAGYPFFANPLSGLWYLPGWVANLFPTAAAFNFLFLAHIFAGGLGIYLVLRDERYSPEIAVLGALVFELMPKLWAHFAMGHVTMVYAVCLTPWLLVVTRRALVKKPGNLYLYLPAFLIAGIILADPRWLPYALILWAAFLWQLQRSRSLPAVTKKNSLLKFFLLHLSLGGLMAAVLILPMIQYTRLSTRSLLTLEDNLAFSLPLSKILLLLFPSPGITAEWVFYMGGLGFIALLLTLFDRKIRSESAIWLGVLFLGIVIAVSASIPGLSQIWKLPGLSLIRVPSRAMFMTGISACFLIPLVCLSIYEKSVNKKATNLILAACIALGAIITAVSFMGGSTGAMVGVIQGSISLIIFAVMLFVFLNRECKPAWTWLLIGVLLVDFYTLNIQSMKFIDQNEALTGGKSLLNALPQNEDGAFRIFTPSNSLPQQAASLAGIEMLNGIDPLQLISLHNFELFSYPAAEEQIGYSVTFPPFRTGDPQTDNREIILDTYKLGLLNTKFVLSAFPIPNPRLKSIAESPDGFVYENLDFLPRAWVQETDAPLGTNILESPEVHKSANQIELTTGQGGLLVLSEVMYPGWKAWIDGQPTAIEPQEGLLRGIMIPAGEHKVVLRFQPVIFWIALSTSLLTIFGIIFYRLIVGRKSHDRT